MKIVLSDDELARLADAIVDRLRRTPAASTPEGYTSATYPHGAKAFRRHIARGMRAARVGKGYWVSRDDAEAYWATLRRAAPPRPLTPPADDGDAEIRANLLRAGIELRRAG